MKVHKSDSNQKCTINFHRRGWFAKDKELCKLDGEVFIEGEGKKKKKVEPMMVISGNWNSEIFL